MHALRDKTHYAHLIGEELGVQHFAAIQAGLSGSLATGAGYLRQYVQTQIKQYVDVQYRLLVDATGKRALLNAAISGHLDQISPEYYREVEAVVAKLAQRLTQQYKRRNKRAQRGVLDVRHMLRKNLLGASRKKSRQRCTSFAMSATPSPESRGFSYCCCTA
jgi:hypothetical protein